MFNFFSLEEFVLRSLRASPLAKPFFNARWVTAVGVCVLKCFSRLEMCTHIEDSFFSNRFPL